MVNPAEALPSQQSAAALVAGQPGAWLQVGIHALGRGALIGVGLAVAGVPARYLLRAALGGTVAIELFVIMHELATKGKTT